MCLIIAKEVPEVQIPLDHIRAAYSNNNDGFGIAYAEGGRVHVTKGLFELPVIEQLFNEHAGKRFVAHFRFATCGGVTVENCHPFKILDKETDGKDLYMVHNGVIRNVDSTATESDTAVFVKNMLVPLFKQDPNLIYTADFRKLLEEAIGGGNKLTFIDGDGQIIIINEDAGSRSEQLGNTWYSNKYSLNVSHRSSGKSNNSTPLTYTGNYYPRVDEILQGTAAQRAGIQVGDIVVRVNNVEITKFEDITEQAQKGHAVHLELYRPSKSKFVAISVKPKLRMDDGSKRYIVGIASKTTTWAPTKKWNFGQDFNNPVFKSAKESAAVFQQSDPTSPMSRPATNLLKSQPKREYPEYCYDENGTLNAEAVKNYHILNGDATPISPAATSQIKFDFDVVGETCPVMQSMEEALLAADVPADEEDEEQ